MRLLTDNLRGILHHSLKGLRSRPAGITSDNSGSFFDDLDVGKLRTIRDDGIQKHCLLLVTPSRATALNAERFNAEPWQNLE